MPNLILKIYSVALFFAFFPVVIPETLFVSVLALGILASTLHVFWMNRIRRDYLLMGLSLAVLLLTFPSLAMSIEPNILIPFAYLLLPFVFWLSFYFSIGKIDYRSYERTFKAAVLVGLGSMFIQLLVSPDVFGLMSNSVYANELTGTTSFRLTGLLGSPQNASLLLSAALFFKYSEHKSVNILVKSGIIVCGAATLSLFFGIAVIFFILSQLPKTLITLAFGVTAIIFPYLTTVDFSNTPLEFVSFAELAAPNERFVGWQARDPSFFQELFGHGPGTATQGIIDRGYVNFNVYGSESYLLVLLHEFGYSFFICFAFLFFAVFLIKSWNKKNRNSFSGHYSIISLALFSLLVTPNFSSLRIRTIFIPIFLYFIIEHCSLESSSIEKKADRSSDEKHRYFG